MDTHAASDATPAKFGAVKTVFTQASNFGERSTVYNGVDVSIDARFGQGGLLRGGVNYGRTMTDECAAPDFPAQFCKTTNSGVAGQALGDLPAPLPCASLV